MAGLGFKTLFTHRTTFVTKVFDVTIPDTIILNPDTIHEVGEKGVPPLTERVQVTVEIVYVFGTVTVTVSVGVIAD